MDIIERVAQLEAARDALQLTVDVLRTRIEAVAQEVDDLESALRAIGAGLMQLGKGNHFQIELESAKGDHAQDQE